MKKENFKMKVSVDGMKFSTSSHQQFSKPAKKMRVYLFPARETVWENYLGRWARDRKLWRKIALQIMEKHGYFGNKIVFSQKAGCQCGCSPGFIADINNGMELFITYNKVKK